MALPWWMIGCLFAMIPVAFVVELLTSDRTLQAVIVVGGWLLLLFVVGRSRTKRGKPWWY